MKAPSYIWLPILATGFNLWLATVVFPARRAHGQPLGLQNEVTLGYCEGNDCHVELTIDGDRAAFDLSRSQTDNETFEAISDFEEEEKDPMLHKMPGLDFEAYVRADIATFYGQESGTMVEIEPDFEGQAGKFVNMSPKPVSLLWVGSEGYSEISDSIPAWSSAGTSTFPGHEFVFVSEDNPEEILCTVNVVKGTSVYYYDPFNGETEFDPARCVPPDDAIVESIEDLSTEDQEKYRAHKFNFDFAALYKNFTGGSEWLTMYPKEKPRHKIWRADYFGQEHHILTSETHFHTDPGAALTEHVLSLDEMRQSKDSLLPLAEFRHPGLLNLTIKAVSCAPRAFEIRNFLSEAEVDHMLNLVKKQTMHRSLTGDENTRGHVSNVRTSRNTWIPRHKDTILNAVYRRAADALRLDEALLRRREAHEIPDFPIKDQINEDLQVVHYSVGQEYTAHHDFGYPIGVGPESPSRSINVCMYLNDVQAGGETAFPRWRNAETGESIKVKPEKGKAMIFYMVNPDGNLDDLTQHAAMPVIQGEKYFVNLWIHDPYNS